MPSRILFVDDEPSVLEGLERTFYSMRNQWAMVFASGGEQALQAMSLDSFDVVVTDMRMPAMNGAQLLEEVSRRFPQTIRIALSGQCEQETVVNSLGPIHQYLSKPTDKNQLKDKILQAIALRDVLENSGLRAVVSQLRTIPSLPSHYQALMAELQSPTADMAKVSTLISEDMGMTAKCLQLVNSSFFGLRSKVSSAGEAVKLLGFDTIRALVLTAHIFSEFQSSQFDPAELRWLWEHSLAVSGMARTLAGTQSSDREMIEDSFTAGLLHDVGKLILASSLSSQYKEVLNLAASKKIPLAVAEKELLGCTHAEVGAYLLGVWGLPSPILLAVAWHQKPSDVLVTEFSPLTVVHAACFYHSQSAHSALADQSSLDLEYLAKLGLQSTEPAWRARFEEILANPTPR